MFNDIPYFKDYQIKNIKLNNNGYVVSKYIGNGQNVYETIIPVTEKNYDDLKEEYYSTLSLYLKNNKKKYIRLNNSFAQYRNINIKRYKKRLKLGLILIGVSLLGVFIHQLTIILFSIILVSIGGILFSYNYDVIHKYKKMLEFKMYIEEYEKLNNIYVRYLNQKNNVKYNPKNTNIEFINEYCEDFTTKKIRKIIKR